MSTPQQRELDKIVERMPKEEYVSLHAIYCDCWRCAEVRQIEKEKRER